MARDKISKWYFIGAILFFLGSAGHFYFAFTSPTYATKQEVTDLAYDSFEKGFVAGQVSAIKGDIRVKLIPDSGYRLVIPIWDSSKHAIFPARKLNTQ